MRPPTDFDAFKRVRRAVRRSAYNPHVPGLHVDLLLLFHFGVVGSISVAIFFFEKCWQLAHQLAESLVPWLNNPLRCWSKLVEKRKRQR